MATRTLQLISYRYSSKQRAHFAIFVPSSANPDLGTLIHVVGAPMAGYMLEFKRNYSPTMTQEPHEMYPIGEVFAANIIESTSNGRSRDNKPRDKLEREAAQVAPPRISENFRAPVNDTTNRRCQEWTIDFVRRLVDSGVIAQTAFDIVQDKRDPPSHGIV
ncbi:hypothetical protein V493_00096 [Pseudogymnoascus sp. VKM F-4281 (FW-2241)]|nr:hypothetical protein V493_00096 [Pseudogymnoascus sp. VKM F-4281 (FW-2241)]